jgi:prepilin-type processing-associated H-X9-DG protein
MRVSIPHIIWRCASVIDKDINIVFVDGHFKSWKCQDLREK